MDRQRDEVAPALWRDLPLLEGLSSDEVQTLRDLALLFLNEKAIEEAAGVQLDQRMRLLIALQAFYRQDPIERLAPT